MKLRERAEALVAVSFVGFARRCDEERKCRDKPPTFIPRAIVARVVHNLTPTIFHGVVARGGAGKERAFTSERLNRARIPSLDTRQRGSRISKPAFFLPPSLRNRRARRASAMQRPRDRASTRLVGDALSRRDRAPFAPRSLARSLAR